MSFDASWGIAKGLTSGKPWVVVSSVRKMVVRAAVERVGCILGDVMGV